MAISFVFVEHYRWQTGTENLRTIICQLRCAAGQATQIYHEKQRKHEEKIHEKYR